ncbi:MAG: PAS domain S-box protein [Candidatus Marinimicrobia bacterium]|nr:PAS domain S-box protein [Candidatus Neomarinimicrobiota bacterium]
MSLPNLHINDSIAITIVSANKFFQAQSREMLGSIISESSMARIFQYSDISELPADEYSKLAYFLIIDVNSLDLEKYFEYIRNLKSKNILCLSMFLLKSIDKDKYEQIESELLIDDVMVYNPDDPDFLKYHLFRDLKILLNFESKYSHEEDHLDTTINPDNKLLQLKVTLDNITEGILITDIYNKIWYMNEAFGYYFGYTTNMINEIDLNKVACLTDDIFQADPNRDVTAKRKDGSEFPCNIKFSEILNDDFELLGNIFVFADLTERVQAEEKRREMAKAYGVIEMAGAASHEINQPLQAISMISELLTMQTDNNDENKKYLENIHTQCQRIKEITLNIQKIAKDGQYKTKNYLAGEQIVDIFSVNEN